MRIVTQLATYLASQKLLVPSDFAALDDLGLDLSGLLPARLEASSSPGPSDRWFFAQDDLELGDRRARRPPTHSRWGRRPKP
jgi:hypothetical protein